MSTKDFRKAFDLYDLNHDGVISSYELKIVLIALGYHSSDQDVAEVMADLDANHNGVIDYPEFVRLMETYPPKEGVVRTLDDTLLAFAAFDRDGNGVISEAELKETMEVIGMALTEAELEAAMKEADVNGDGMIDYTEFVRVSKR